MTSEFEKYTKLDSSFTQNQGKLGSATRYERDLFKKAVDFFTNETSSLFILFIFLDLLFPTTYDVNFSIIPGIAALAGIVIGGGIASKVVDSGINMATSSLDYARQQELQEDSQEFNAAQAELNRDWQEKMYNQYYSPSATVRQYREAGINPVLASGISPGTPPAGSSASSGISSSPHTSPGTSSDIVNGVYDLLVKKEQIQNLSTQRGLLEAEIENKNADTEYKKADTDYKISETDYLELKKYFDPYIWANEIKQGDLNMELTRGQIRTVDHAIAQMDSSTLRNIVLNYVDKYKLKLTDAEYKLLNQKNLTEQALTKLTWAKKETEGTIQMKNFADATRSNSDASEESIFSESILPVIIGAVSAYVMKSTPNKIGFKY